MSLNAEGDDIIAVEADWKRAYEQPDDNLLSQHGPIDLIIGSDLLYTNDGARWLAAMFAQQLKANPAARVLYAHTCNRYEILDHDFFLGELESVGLEFTVRWGGSWPEDRGLLDDLFPDQKIRIFEVTLRGQ